MHLYILTNHMRKDIEVLLDKGCEPLVGGYRRSTDIEPAIWFKVMVLDAVTVDCDERRLSWIPLCDGFMAPDSGIAMSDSYRLSTEPSSVDDHRVIGTADESVCCPLEEVFETIPRHMAAYQNNTMATDTFNEHIMRLLHVHILPSVRLSIFDSDSLRVCIASQEDVARQLDNDILLVVQKQNAVKQSVANLRKKFLDELIETKSNMLFPCNLIDALLKDIMQDIEYKWNELAKAQTVVELTKEASDNGVILGEKRVQRDALQVSYEKLIDIREKLKDKLKAARNPKSGLAARFKGAFSSPQPDPLHEMYFAMVKKVEEFMYEIERLTTRKLLVLSVKEAARCMLDDLQSGNDPFRTDTECVGSARATDVLGTSIQTPWKSLAEQISAILDNHGSEISHKHRAFCRDVVDICSAALKEKQCLDAARRKSDRDSARSSTHSDSFSVVSDQEFSHWNHGMGGGGNRLFSTQTSTLSRQSENNNNLSTSLTFSLSTKDAEMKKKIVTATRSVSEVKSTSSLPRGQKGRKSRDRDGLFGPSFQAYVPVEFLSFSDDPACTPPDPEAPVIIFDASRDNLRAIIDNIKTQILTHFETISKDFEVNFSDSQGSSCGSKFRQIWLDYETHFYGCCMESLMDVYRSQYANVTDALCESLLALTPSDLRLDDAALVHLLKTSGSTDEEENSTVANIPQSDSHGTLCADDTASSSTSRSTATLQSNILSIDSDCVDVPHSTLDENKMLGIEEDEDEVCNTLCRFRSENSRPHRLRTVRISLPVTLLPNAPVLIYERTLSPLPTDSACVGGAEFQLSRSSSVCQRTMAFKAQYRTLFSPALKRIDGALMATTPSAKLRQLTECLHNTVSHVRKFYADLYGMPSSASGCDELMDALVILLCNVDGTKLAELYCQLMLLTDMMAPWMQRGPYSFTLVQFFGACQFIQEQLMFKRNRSSPVSPQGAR